MNEIKDIHLKKDMTVKELVSQLENSGFQAQNLGEAVQIVKEAKKNSAKTFISFTSNMSASGLRGILIDLIKKNQVDVIVTSSGSIDEDLIRSKLPYLKGTFETDDAKLGQEGVNRMGNIFVPNDRYEFLDEEMVKILEKLYEKKKNYVVSELLKEVGNMWGYEDSFIVQAAKAGVEVYCPGITDGSFGMQLTFFKQKHPEFNVDTIKDFENIINSASGDEKRLGIILGGGISKHHTIISNIISGGFDYAVYVNSSTPYHGSLSNATTSEAKSWGKIKPNSKSITIYGDAAIMFPLLVASVDEML